MQTEVKEAHEAPLFRSATEAAEAIRRKEISSRELTGMLIKRIEAANPAVNAVVEPRREAALREAAAGVDKGAASPNGKPVGTVTREQLRTIAKIKVPDPNAGSIEAAMKVVEGTARRMGVRVSD